MELQSPNKKYHHTKTMVHSCQYHVIFCPKYRRKVLTPPIAERLENLILEAQNHHGFRVIELEVMVDHVHLLLDVIDQKLGVYTIVGRIKGLTSRILREEFPELKSKLPTLWTRGKFISSVGSVSLEVVKKYIMDQKNV